MDSLAPTGVLNPATSDLTSQYAFSLSPLTHCQNSQSGSLLQSERYIQIEFVLVFRGISRIQYEFSIISRNLHKCLGVSKRIGGLSKFLYVMILASQFPNGENEIGS